MDDQRAQLDEMSKKINALRCQKSGNLDQVGDRVAESGGSIRVFLLNEQIDDLIFRR